MKALIFAEKSGRIKLPSTKHNIIENIPQHKRFGSSKTSHLKGTKLAQIA